nr:MAG TPA: hypothetical protein [Caudoviricetes sp.]
MLKNKELFERQKTKNKSILDYFELTSCPM